LPEEATQPTARTLAGHINAALTDELARHPELIVFGEDVAKKGGVYNVTHDLQRRFGMGRVFDTLLDETSILGIAQGAAHAGLIPIPEIQYLAYIHNALDQIRGEAASLQFFSSGQFRNPLVVRVPGLAYQKGFGGHFHNDTAWGPSATSRVSSWPSPPVAMTPPGCSAAAWRWPPRTDGSSSFSSPSPSTTSAISTPTATAGG
jgi:2-oxoisovalerate dehydrogenase E1 component